MAIDISSFDESEAQPVDIASFDEPEAKEIDLSGFDSTADGGEVDISSFDDEGPATSDIVKGVGVEIGSGILGQAGGTAAGAAIGSVVPGIGTAIGAGVGYTVGSIGSGIAGSIAAQKIEGQEDISWGRAIAAGLINLVPGGAAKGVKGATKITGAMVGRAATKEAVKGAAFGATEATSRAVIDEGRLPTKEELAQYGGAGALFGGALGAATPKIGKTFDKFLGKSAQQIDDDIASGVIDYKDLDFVAKQGAEGKKSPPPMPETRGGGEQFHGTTGDLRNGLSDGSYNEQNIYGQGLYTTDAMDVAKGYSGKGTGDGSVIYGISEKAPVNFMDLDGIGARNLARGYDDEIIQEALDGLPADATAADLYDAMRQLPYTADEIQESFLLIQEKLEGAGYGGIRHTGGRFTGQNPHNVKIYFDPKNQLDVKERVRFDVPELTQLKRKVINLKKARRDLPYADREAENAWRREIHSVYDRIDELNKPKPSMEGILRESIENTKARVKSDAAAEVLLDDTPFTGMKNRFLSMVAPSKVVGKEARNESIRFRKLAAADEELGSKIEKKVTAAITKDPSVEGKVNDFLSGGDLDPSLGKLGDELTVYRNRLDELQGEVIQQLEVEHMANLGPEKLAKVTDKILRLKGMAETKKIRKELSKLAKRKKGLEATPKLIQKIKKSRADGNFTRREYKMFTDSEFVPDPKLRAAAVEELAQSILKRGQKKTIASARNEADKHFDKLENRSARSRKLAESRGAAAQPLKAALKKRKNVGEAEKAWLGEITETGERIRGTLTGVGKMVARNKTDANIATILQKQGLAVPSNSKVPGLMELRLKSGEPTGLHVKPEVQASINRLYLDGAQSRSNNPVIAGLQDLYSSAVGLSKATKVLLNPPSYAVQVYGNTMNLLGMGVNPFGGAGKGARLALAEFGGLDHIMSPAGKESRQAFLKEMNDMTKYGIKGENILESDMRDAFERGLFSKAIEKPVGFFGKAYSVPDTVGRYVGWKAQQKTLKKIYPHLDDESVKRLGAEVINDTYQNYDRLSSTVKTLSRAGVMPQFASFTAEFMRNQYNQAKIIKQMLGGTFGADLGIDVSKANLAAMRVEGAKRLTALTAIYGGTAAAIDALNSDGGVTDDNKDAIQNSLPSWDRHKKLAIRMSEDGKSGSYANTSYVAPQALGMAAVDAAMSDTPLENLSGMLVEELVGEGSFVNRGLMEAINNRNDRGNKISYNDNDLINAKERLGHFIKETFKPGISREIKKMDEATRGVGDLSVKQVLARQVGYRVNSFNLAENNKFIQMEHLDNANGSKREYTKARDRGNLRPEDLEAVYQKANEAYLANMEQIRVSDDNLKKTNHTEDERIQVMKDAGVSSKNILATLRGSYDDIPRIKTQSTSEVYDSLPADKHAKMKAIAEIRKTDRGLAQRLLQNVQRERKVQSRNISAKEALMMNMDVGERASEIMDHPNPSGYLREMQRKGIATKRVTELVRMKMNQ